MPYKKLLALMATFVFASLSMPTMAAGPSFSYANFSTLSSDGVAGIGFEGSLDLGDGSYVYASHEGFPGQTTTHFGGGIHFPTTSGGEGYMRAAYKDIYDSTYGYLYGFTVAGGVKMETAANMELDMYVGYTYDDWPSEGYIYGVSLMFKLGGQLGLTAGYSGDTSYAPTRTVLKLGAQINF